MGLKGEIRWGFAGLPEKKRRRRGDGNVKRHTENVFSCQRWMHRDLGGDRKGRGVKRRGL